MTYLVAIFKFRIRQKLLSGVPNMQFSGKDKNRDPLYRRTTAVVLSCFSNQNNISSVP